MPKPLLGPRSLRPVRINRDTRQQDVGEWRGDEGTRQHRRLYWRLTIAEFRFLPMPPPDAFADAAADIIDRSAEHVYEDHSSFAKEAEDLIAKWTKVDAEAERRKKPACRNCGEPCDKDPHYCSTGCAAHCGVDVVGIELRRLHAQSAFAELGRIVEQHAGDARLGVWKDSNGLAYDTRVQNGVIQVRDRFAPSGWVNLRALEALAGAADAWSRIQQFGPRPEWSFRMSGKSVEPETRTATSLADVPPPPPGALVLKADKAGDALPKESRLDFLRRELRENTTLSLGEVDHVARGVCDMESYSDLGLSPRWLIPPGLGSRISLAWHSSPASWTYRDRNGNERRIPILGGGEPVLTETTPAKSKCDHKLAVRSVDGQTVRSYCPCGATNMQTLEGW